MLCNTMQSMTLGHPLAEQNVQQMAEAGIIEPPGTPQDHFVCRPWSLAVQSASVRAL